MSKSKLLSQALFLGCVRRDKLLSMVMLPNTQHITDKEAIREIHNKLNDVVAFHGSRNIFTGHIYKQENGVCCFYDPSTDDKNQTGHKFFDFQSCSKRYTLKQLENTDNPAKQIHQRQKEYLDSTIITHCWAALHKGLVVGLVAYPLIKNDILHDRSFERYKTLARMALQKIGYVVACDLVLDHNQELKIFNIHKLYEKKGRKIPYFTRQLPLTKHLRLVEENLLYVD